MSPDGRTLAAMAGGIDLWDVSTRKVRQSLEETPSTLLGNKYLGFSPDGQSLYCGMGGDPKVVGKELKWVDGKLSVWDVQAGQRRAEFSLPFAIWSGQMSPDGSTLALGLLDGSVVLWDVNAGRQHSLLKGPPFSPSDPWMAVVSVAFSPDGKLLATAWGEGQNRRAVPIILWHLPSGQQRAVLHGHTSAVRGLAFSPDGQTLASGDDEGMVRLWSAR